MIKIDDLKKIKDNCFYDVYRLASDKKNVAIKFSPINAEYLQAIMSNGVQYARLITKLDKMVALQDISISWQDFEMITKLFVSNLSYTVQKNTIIFKSEDNKTKYSCQFYKSEFNERCNFKFDFNSENTELISTDNAIIVKQPKGSPFRCFVLKEDKIYSTDGAFGTINFTQHDIGNFELKLNRKIPSGKWYFNKDYKVMVSEDKSMAYCMEKIDCSFPTVALGQVASTNLSNWFKCNKNTFKKSISSLKDINDKIYFDLYENKVVAHVTNDKANKCEIELDVEFKQQPKIKQIILNEKYIEMLCQCSDEDNTLTIEFDDNPSQMLVRATTSNLIIFGMRCN